MSLFGKVFVFLSSMKKECRYRRRKKEASQAYSSAGKNHI
jgi:hypothetical protein